MEAGFIIVFLTLAFGWMMIWDAAHVARKIREEHKIYGDSDNTRTINMCVKKHV